MNNIFNNLNNCTVSFNINKYKIPVTYFEPNRENAEWFNKLLNFCRMYKYNELKMTKSKGICKQGLILPAYNYSFNNLGAQLIILNDKAYKIQFRCEPKIGDKKMTGTQAYFMFKALCKEEGINLDNYIIENGKEIKEEIEKPYIKLGKSAVRNLIYNHVNHIDFHSSYPTGLINTHPEFKPVIEKLYNGRHDHPEYKGILNYTIGMMQSELLGYKFTHLSRDAIKDNNDRIRDLTNRLEAAGRIVLLYNTDGIWYYGNPYHDMDEGPNLGEWSNDHVNCKFRIKSEGAYEFIENGKYTPVVRGLTKLDKIKDRSEWSWGDIYNNPQIYFTLTNMGILIREELDFDEL